MARHSSHILALARKGAEHRYQELSAEIGALVKQFPHLRSPKAGAAESAVESAQPPASGRRRRRRMSASARKAVSERMKRYWAARRARRKT